MGGVKPIIQFARRPAPEKRPFEALETTKNSRFRNGLPPLRSLAVERDSSPLVDINSFEQTSCVALGAVGRPEPDSGDLDTDSVREAPCDPV